eukprot:4395353-Pyramimonas_sp.AAC.1
MSRLCTLCAFAAGTSRGRRASPITTVPDSAADVLRCDSLRLPVRLLASIPGSSARGPGERSRGTR